MTDRTDVSTSYLTADADVDLPPSAVEERFLREALRRVRSLESRARGLFAEVLIADFLPGSELGPHVMSRWDLRWEGITIAVRTTGTVNSYSEVEKPASGWAFQEHASYDDAAQVLSQERQRCWTDVVVLAHHQGAVLSDGWTFHVLTAQELGELPHRISPALAQCVAPAVRGHGLGAAIKTAGLRAGGVARRGAADGGASTDAEV